MGFSGGAGGKEPACQCRRPKMPETRIRCPGREDSLEKDMATHSSILAWRILWIEESGGLQSMGHKESGRTEGLSLSIFTR